MGGSLGKWREAPDEAYLALALNSDARCNPF